MSLCPEREQRDAMSDGEFWEHVLLGGRRPAPEDDEIEIDPAISSSPCPECGEVGACSWDSEGRALIHALDGSDS